MKYFILTFLATFVIALVAGVVNYNIGFDRGLHTCHVKAPYSCDVEAP